EETPTTSSSTSSNSNTSENSNTSNSSNNTSTEEETEFDPFSDLGQDPGDWGSDWEPVGGVVGN
ncbi:MAG: hypothetical protein SPF70_07220, partial [Lachnospiraceae bacterium]|nr:hypothetical protein [Lachnospiraceae bacterium]